MKWKLGGGWVLRRSPEDSLAAAERISVTEAKRKIHVARHADYVRHAVRLLEHMAQISGHGRLLDKANHEDEERRCTREYLEGEGRAAVSTMPDWVRDCIFRALAEPAPGRHTFYLRDRCIAYAVCELVFRYELKPTRNRAATGAEGGDASDFDFSDGTFLIADASACSIVAEALAQLGCKLKEASVEEIYANRRF